MSALRIGMDYGTNYTYIGFVHGVDERGHRSVQPLMPAGCEGRGIPSIYYNDGKREAFGLEAERLRRKFPANSVASVKAHMLEGNFHLGGKSYTPRQIIVKLLGYFLECAEECAEQRYQLRPDAIELVLAVPVDFDSAQIEVLRRAVSQVRLKSGHPVRLLDLIQEPVASAIRYAGMDAGGERDIAVFDLGGGTLDIAIVHAGGAADAPYRVIDQGGDRSLGGDLWDREMEELLARKFRAEAGIEPPEQVRREISNEARSAKEQLTDAASVECTFTLYAKDGEERDVQLTVTRQEFEAETEGLMARAVEALAEVLKRQGGRRLSQLLLTGGSSRMPQVARVLRESGVLPKGMELRLFRPERAICEGAAIYADLVCYAEPVGGQEDVLQNIAPHGYGVIYRIPERGDEPMILLLIRKGDPLPASVQQVSAVPPGESSMRSLYTICETDAMEAGDSAEERGKYLELGGMRLVGLIQGRQVMEAELLRRAPVPPGTQAKQTLTLDSSLKLSFQSVDEANNARVENEIHLHGLSADFD